MRRLLIRARKDEDWDGPERWILDAKNPDLYDDDLREAFEGLGRLSDTDWNDIDTADKQVWNQAFADFGDLISDAEGDDLAAVYAEIDTSDFGGGYFGGFDDFDFRN